MVRFRNVWASLVGVMLLAGVPTWAGGGPENLLLIVDPTDPASLHLGHYYQNARGIPESNVLYLDLDAASFEEFMAFQGPAWLETLEDRGIADHIDYVLVAPRSSFFVEAGALGVSDPCYPVTRFSLSAMVSLSGLAADLESGVAANLRNGFFSDNDDAVAFSSSAGWSRGQRTDGPGARRYHLGAMLGYLGERGNTVDEIRSLIDRSVAADGSWPKGVFCFLTTDDERRSSPRDLFFADTVAALAEVWERGILEDAVLPAGRDDVIGLLTGWRTPSIREGDFTLLPGAFCDHLTSYSATFDEGTQTKLSEWIAKGASGSVGAVEEPCNYPGKFPHPRVLLYYAQGATLGESVFRSLEYFPFQGLIYGDPLTQPFATKPRVDVDLPVGAWAGSMEIVARAMAGEPGLGIRQLRCLLDGVEISSAPGPTATFVVDTSRFPDGWHDLRVIAEDSSRVRTTGGSRRWVQFENHDQTVSLESDRVSGDLSTLFELTARTTSLPRELRLVSNGRVLASSSLQVSSRWSLSGLALGAGPVELRVEADWGNGERAVSAPLSLDIRFESPPPGAPGGDAPMAFSYGQSITGTTLLELPAWDPEGAPLHFRILESPQQSRLLGSGPHRLLIPVEAATGVDSLIYTVGDGAQWSRPEILTIEYHLDETLGDGNGDGLVDIIDVVDLLCHVATGGPRPLNEWAADLDGNGELEVRDASILLEQLLVGRGLVGRGL